MNPGACARAIQSRFTRLLQEISIGRIVRFLVVILPIPAVVSIAGVSGTQSGPHGIGNLLPDLAVPFVANTRQLDPNVQYYARIFAGTAFVTRKGALVLSLPAPAGSEIRLG